MLKCAGLRSPSHTSHGNQDSIYNRPNGPKFPLYEKEFGIVFDERKPIGIGFCNVNGNESDSLHGNLTCSVQNIVSSKVRDNHAYDHNEHCYLSCDVSRVITPGLRIRAINDMDLFGIPYDSVISKIKTFKRPILLTFVDIKSKCTKNADNGVETVGPELRSPSIDGLNEELLRLRQTLEDALAAKQEAEAQVEQYKKWNNTLLATNDEMGDQQIAVLDQIRKERTEVEEKQALARALQVERDKANQAMEALTIENKSIHERLEAIHERLESVQQEKKIVEDELQALKRRRGEEIHLLEMLRKEIHAKDDVASELDKLLQVEVSASPADVDHKLAHEQVMATLRDQRAAHMTHKSSIERALIEHKSKAKDDRELIEKLQCEVDALQYALIVKQSSPALPASSNNLPEGTKPIAWLQQQLDELRTSFSKTKTEHQAAKVEWDNERQNLLNRLLQGETREKELEAIIAKSQATAAEEIQVSMQEERSHEKIVEEFIQRLSTKGFRVHKHGRHGSTHDRFIYSDPCGHWLSWLNVEEARNAEAFRHPSKKIVVDMKDIVDVLPGKQTAVFARANSQSTPPSRCFSLVCAKPCRTIDIETDTPEQAQRMIQGFRLVREKLQKNSTQATKTEST